MADLIEELTTGRPSNRLDSPVFQRARSIRPRTGNRHQTDAEHPAKSRPRPPYDPLIQIPISKKRATHSVI